MLERMERTADDVAETTSKAGFYSLIGVLGAVLIYSALHITARLIASYNLGEDDPFDAILTQTLALGYIPGRLPLYDWLVWLLGQVTGPGALRFQLLKYGLLTATCGFIFLSARRVMKGDAVWAFLSVEALALIYQISWRFHEGFTHPVGAMTAVAATFWALTRLGDGGRARDYAVLGVCVGLGVLTVPTYWIYLAGLIGAAFLQPALRAVLKRPAIVLSVSVAMIIAAPHYVWLAATPEGLGALLPHMVKSAHHGHWYLALMGIRRAITEPIMYLSPLIFLYPLFFWGYLGALRQTVRITPNRDAEPDYEQLILHQTLFSIGALVVGALIWGINRYPTHDLMPLFLVTSIWLTALARKAARGPGELRRFVIMALSVAVFAFFARCANMYVLEPVCQICRWGIPYEELAAEIKKTHPKGPLWIKVFDNDLGGNLLRFFPKGRVDMVETSLAKPKIFPLMKGREQPQTVYIWDASNSRAEKKVQKLQQLLFGQSTAEIKTITIAWRNHLWKPDGYRKSVWRVAFAPSHF
ncbi:MAG: glycosyltransferase family 39 protein [Alphaproteobacteria bacterium]